MSKKILWLDVETTGLNPSLHGIRELGYILEIDGEIVGKDILYINPFSYNKQVEIDPKALELSGVTIEDIKEYPNSTDGLYSFLTKLSSYIDHATKEDRFTIAGYNPKFDYDFLFNWFEDNGIVKSFNQYFHYKVLDVFPLVMTLNHLNIIDTPNDKLKTVCEYFNIPIEAHNALSDITATKQLFEKITDSFIRDGRTKSFSNLACPPPQETSFEVEKESPLEKYKSKYVYLIYQYNRSKTDSRFLFIICEEEELALDKCKQLNKIYPSNQHYAQKHPLVRI